MPSQGIKVDPFYTPPTYPHPETDSLVRGTPRGRLTSTDQHTGNSSSNSNILADDRRPETGSMEEAGDGKMRCAPTLQERGGWSVAEGYFQPKESASSSSQLDSSTASGQWRVIGVYIGRSLSNPAQWKGLTLLISVVEISKPPLPMRGIVNYPIPANTPSRLTASPTPDAHSQDYPKRKLGCPPAR